MAAKRKSRGWSPERRVTWRLDERNHNYLVQEAARLGLRSLNATLNVLLSQIRSGGSKPAKSRKKH